MYQQLSKMLPEEKIEAITKSLVALNSINGTLGEGKKSRLYQRYDQELSLLSGESVTCVGAGDS